jgi:hypothetical protein
VRDAELVVGLCEQLNREYDEMSFWEICNMLAIPSGEERVTLLGE